MKIILKKAKFKDRKTFKNLLEKYFYEFSQYDALELNKRGLYGYKWLKQYWTDKNRFAYFIEADKKLAGFLLVNNVPEIAEREMDFSMAEFFIIYRYRRSGVGKKAFFEAVNLHRGKWQLKYHPKNLGSAHFWTKVIGEYTNGNYEIIKSHPNLKYDDGTFGDIFFFET